jgi:hypothetical protein
VVRISTSLVLVLNGPREAGVHVPLAGFLKDAKSGK